MVLSIANKNRNRNKNRSCGTTVVFAVYIDGYAQNTHTHIQTHTIYPYMRFHSESSITWPDGRERSGKQTYINPNLKPHTHKQSNWNLYQLCPLFFPPSLSLFSHTYFLIVFWAWAELFARLCVFFLCFATKRFVIELWHRNQFGIYSCSSCNWKLHKL